MGLVALLGIATIAHALGTSVRRRRRDLAILKTLGFVRGQIRVAVITQATTLALLALALGIPIGMIVGRSAWLAFADRQGVVPEALLGSWTIVAIVPATVLLANLVAALPGRAAARLTPATVLRTE
jgi:ABC-type antimicrobial peptide transport system permease subunit